MKKKEVIKPNLRKVRRNQMILMRMKIMLVFVVDALAIVATAVIVA